MTRIPIIIIHSGSQFYLKNLIHHIRVFNPEADVFLLGDDSNKDFAKNQLTHIQYNKYSASANNFAEKYIHLNTNDYHYELFCIQRWFIIREFVEERNIKNFFVCDSDELLFCNIESVMEPYIHYDFTIGKYGIPNSMLWSFDGIVKFTNFVNKAYQNNELLSKLKSVYESCFIDGHRISMGGVSDMVLFSLYQEQVGSNVIDLSDPSSGACWDTAMTHGRGFEMQNGLKKIVWENNIPYGLFKGEKIRFYGLHFLGQSKMRQHYYLVDDTGQHIDPIPFKLKFDMAINWLVKFFNGFKRPLFFIRRYINKVKTNYWRKKYNFK